jgi:hypothetical protein
MNNATSLFINRFHNRLGRDDVGRSVDSILRGKSRASYMGG